MELPFLLHVLKNLGFTTPSLTSLINAFTSRPFSILLNGTPLPPRRFGKFSSSRGLSQGYPLSPFLFILGAKAFTDYLFMFYHAIVFEACSVQKCLDPYASWSGQKINVNKSSIFFSKNTSTHSSQAVKKSLTSIDPPPNQTFWPPFSFP